MAFVELPAVRFTMGSASSESGRNDDEVLHDVGYAGRFSSAGTR
jgi:hypothetical protein